MQNSKTVKYTYDKELNSLNYLKSMNLICGGFQLRAVLNAFGKDNKPDLQSYLSIGTRLTGFTLLQLQKAIITHGLYTMPNYALGRSDNEKIQILKDCTDRDQPIILPIGYGYKNNGFSDLKRKLFGHWISIWGYDDDVEKFYIYDSLCKRNPDNDLPAGNCTRSYKELLRDWQGTFYFRFLKMKNLYLPISQKD